MKTAISIPDSLFQAGEQFAKRVELSRSELHAVLRFILGLASFITLQQD